MNDAILATVMADTINTGDEDNQPWLLYENTDGLHNWTLRDALEERVRFINEVIRRYYEEVRK